ncbi:MAG TPA: hypothetical protein VIX37_10350, partial [Candidatus Sulfotelmatobacter sp.]
MKVASNKTFESTTPRQPARNRKSLVILSAAFCREGSMQLAGSAYKRDAHRETLLPHKSFALCDYPYVHQITGQKTA